MSQWIVTQGNNQFSVDGLEELEQLARQGRLGAGDMVQPPGTSEWIYVSEIEELARHVSPGPTLADDDDLDFRSGGSQMRNMVAIALVAVILVGGGAMFSYFGQLPGGGERLIGEGGLSYSQMLVTEKGSGLRQQPNENAGVTTPLSKDEVLELVAKRGEWYRARNAGSAEGWIEADRVIPMYMLGGEDVSRGVRPALQSRSLRRCAQRHVAAAGQPQSTPWCRAFGHYAVRVPHEQQVPLRHDRAGDRGHHQGCEGP